MKWIIVFGLIQASLSLSATQGTSIVKMEEEVVTHQVCIITKFEHCSLCVIEIDVKMKKKIFW
jgi:hypothetical protein